MTAKEAINLIIKRVQKEQHKPVLILVQGASGSGKTTFAYSLYGAAGDLGRYWAPVEADHFFFKDGSYTFDGKFLKYAHEFSLSHAAFALYQGKCIAVSNTFTNAWELVPYYELAKTANADVILVRMKTEYENKHNVPKDVVTRHKNNLAKENTYKPDYVIDEYDEKT